MHTHVKQASSNCLECRSHFLNNLYSVIIKTPKNNYIWTCVISNGKKVECKQICSTNVDRAYLTI